MDTDNPKERAVRVAAQTRELEQALLGWTTTFDAIQDGICLLDREGHILRCNRAMHGLMDRSLEELQGHPCHEILHGRPDFIPGCPFQRMLETGERETNEFFIQGRWFEAVTDPVRDRDGAVIGTVHILHDVTVRRKSEADLQRITALYATLSQANEAIVRAKSEDELFSEIVQVCVDFGHFELAWIGEPGEDGCVHVLVARGPAKSYAEGLRVSTDPQRDDNHGPTGSAFLKGGPVVAQDWEQDLLMEPWRERGRTYGFRSSAALPLRRGGQTVATLNLYDREANAFTPDRLHLLEEMAGDLSYTLDALASERLRQQAEADLKASEERFRLSFDNACIGKSLTHPDGRLLRVNEALCDLLGYTRSELEVSSFSAITHPDDLAETREYVRSLLSGERSTCRFEKRFFHKDGHIIWTDVSSSLLRDPVSGEPLNLITDIVDITAQRQAETALREREVQYHNLANSGGALIWTAGTDKLCTYFNEPWLRFTGRALEQELGNGWAEGVHPDDFERCLSTFVSAFDKREPFEMEYRLRHASGEYRWLSDLGTPNYDSGGRFLGYIGHCFDITEHKLAMNRVQAQLEELQRWYTAMLGREERVQELKREVNALCRAHQEEIRYPSQEVS